MSPLDNEAGGGGGAQVTCLAADFYPRHINLTLLRGGQPVDESELTGGLVLPNGNGLYQVRKTLTVRDKELQKKHNYTCTTSHLSLDNRLEVSWRAEFSRLDVNTSRPNSAPVFRTITLHLSCEYSLMVPA